MNREIMFFVTRRNSGIIFRKAHSSALGLNLSLVLAASVKLTGLWMLGGSSIFTHLATPVYHAVPRTKMYFRGFLIVMTTFLRLGPPSTLLLGSDEPAPR